MFKMANFQSSEGIDRFIHSLKKLGVEDELKKLNIQDGDIVKILDFSFEYKEDDN